MMLPLGARAMIPIAASISASSRTNACCGAIPWSRAAPSIDRHHCGLVEFDGSSNTATRFVFGAVSFSNSTNFPPTENSMSMKPVMFPPGRERLVTNPCPTGSAIATKTSGIARVASRTDGNAGPCARIASGCVPTISSAWARLRAPSPSLQRTSILRLPPSCQPSPASDWRRAFSHPTAKGSPSGKGISTPSRRSASAKLTRATPPPRRPG